MGGNGLCLVHSKRLPTDHTLNLKVGVMECSCLSFKLYFNGEVYSAGFASRASKACTVNATSVAVLQSPILLVADCCPDCVYSSHTQSLTRFQTLSMMMR